MDAGILYIADFMTVMSNPKGYEVIKLTQKEMDKLEDMEAPEVILG